MRLILFHPEVAFRDCGHCQRWIYDEETGVPAKHGGQLQPRHAAAPPPCRTSKGCQKGTPEQPRSLNSRNLRAYLFDRQCRAINHWPDDPIVRRNAEIIRTLEQAKADHDQREMQYTILHLAKLATRRV